MNYKVVGALLVFLACGSCGFIMAYNHNAKIRLMNNLIAALDDMISELQYRGTPLPNLCRYAAERNNGKIKHILMKLADELDAQISPDAGRCMASVLDQHNDLEMISYSILMDLGMHMGKFDLTGQVRGLEVCRSRCQNELAQLMRNKDMRLRSYQTLGLCAGAALAILFV